MRVGRMRHRLEIQRATETRDAAGGVVQTWSTLDTRWASIEALTGREYFMAKQVQSDATHRIRLRYYEGLRPSDRLYHNVQGLTFNIVSLLDVGLLDKEWEILAVASSDLIPLLNDVGVVVEDDSGNPIYV